MSDWLSEDRKLRARRWFESLRDRLCAEFERIEDEAGVGPVATLPAGRFERKSWTRADAEGGPGGGGVMALMRGRVFEKIGVNISTVEGAFSADFRAQIPGAAEDGKFWAAGLSLVAHPRSPHIPPAHMNTRHLRTTKAWFGGGADLNPIIPDAGDTADFHAALRSACERFDPGRYGEYKAWCDRYFWLPHRQEHRGVGGIFFDYLEADWERDFAFTQAIGEAFLEVYPRLVRRQMGRPWNEAERRHQLVRRGRYAEFNLLYDRGTQFGLKTGGNVEAILMSLPPEAAWP